MANYIARRPLAFSLVELHREHAFPSASVGFGLSKSACGTLHQTVYTVAPLGILGGIVLLPFYPMIGLAVVGGSFLAFGLFFSGIAARVLCDTP